MLAKGAPIAPCNLKEHPTSIAIRGDLTSERLPELFAYEAKSGLLTWRKSPITHWRTAGKIAVSKTRGGYMAVRYNGKSYPAHRIVFALHHGRWPSQIDHIDGNRMNNRLENLREATAAQNGQNRGKPKNNTSGFKGVRRNGKKWQASIMANGQVHYLGLFEEKAAAALAYDEAARNLHGEFAKTNEDLVQKPASYLTGEPNIKMFRPLPYLRAGI